MSYGVGLSVTHRRRFAPLGGTGPTVAGEDADVLALLADVARELCVRLDGDEGRVVRYSGVELSEPVYPGDVLEATGLITEVGPTTRTIAFEIRKVVERHRGGATTAADALATPIGVCQAVGYAIVPVERQRRPRLVLPALAGPETGAVPSLPEPHPLITPPPHVIVTPPRVELILTASLFVASRPVPGALGSVEELVSEATRCREAGAAVVTVTPLDGASDLGIRALEALRERTDLVVGLALGPTPRAGDLGLRPDFASLDAGVYSGVDRVRGPSRSSLRELVRRANELAVRIELACYEAGHVQEIRELAGEGFLPAGALVRLSLGVPGAIFASEAALRFLAAHTPPGWCRSVSGSGPQGRALLERAVHLGEHPVVGPALDLDLPAWAAGEAVPAEVRRFAELGRSLGRELAEPERAREVLGLTP